MKRRIITVLLAISLALGISSSAFAEEEASLPASEHQVIAYYFHGTARCYSCKLIEDYTEEAIKTGFPDELEDGRLVWKSLNMEKSDNRHFVTDYGLYTKSVVISKMENGEETDWKNLSRVWNLIRNKPAFIAYIQDETRNMLEEKSE
ncbi:MAG: nitrophenyl compound nitroreductase subunit ArsF family protein [Alphaproteobacteria bacterium]